MSKKIGEEIIKYKDIISIAVYRKDGIFFEKIILGLMVGILGRGYTEDDLLWGMGIVRGIKRMVVDAFSPVSVEEFLEVLSRGRRSS